LAVLAVLAILAILAMSYDFSFDKKSVFLIAVGCIAIGVLLFVAGFILGLDRGVSEARLQLEKEYSAKATTGANPKVSPQTDKPEPAPTVALNTAPALATEKASPSETAEQGKPAQVIPVAAKSEPPASATSVPQAASPAQIANAQPSAEPTKKPSQPAEAEQATSAPSEGQASDDQTGFSLQLGAFQSEENARRFKNNLNARGYSAFVFHTSDTGGRVWHTVRLGHFKDIKGASRAAMTFTSKEQMPAFIRPSDEL
jgi:cell division septation protein DedD